MKKSIYKLIGLSGLVLLLVAVQSNARIYNPPSSSSAVSTSRAVNTTAPLAGGGDLSTDRTLSIPKASSTADGYLSQTDWSTFNNKVATSVTTLSSLASIGTITSGVWNGTIIGAAFGGAGTALSLVPTSPTAVGGSSFNISGNTTAIFGQAEINKRITVNKISIKTSNLTVSSTLDIALYSEDGQTKYLEVTTASIEAEQNHTTSVSSVTLNPGIYYIAVVANGASANFDITTWANDDLIAGITSEPVFSGTKVVTAGTLPSSFNPTSDITQNTDAGPMFRLDN